MGPDPLIPLSPLWRGKKKKSAEIWTSKSVTYQIEQLLKQTQTQD